MEFVFLSRFWGNGRKEVEFQSLEVAIALKKTNFSLIFAGKNPDVDTSFLPDVDRDEEENRLREDLR